MYNILVVDDDKEIANAIDIYLSREGYNIIKAYDGEEAIQKVNENEIHLIILDIMMPKKDGLQTLEEIRKNKTIPVIMLSAKSEDYDKISGLDLGADDYITKPFSLAIFRARVNNQLRRKKPNINNVFQIDDYYFDFDNMIYRKNQKIIELSKTEQKLLRLLVENRGHTLTRELLVDKIWGSEYVDENALTVTVKRLRGKIEDNEYLKTIYGIGYTWAVK